MEVEHERMAARKSAAREAMARRFAEAADLEATAPGQPLAFPGHFAVKNVYHRADGSLGVLVNIPADYAQEMVVPLLEMAEETLVFTVAEIFPPSAMGRILESLAQPDQ